MARIESVKLVDDVDGGTADETVRFMLDGKPRVIDLNSENAAKLRAVLAPFVDASRPDHDAPRRSGRSGQPSASGGRTTEQREQNRAVRQWARERGVELGDRGRIPSDVLDAYHGRAELPASRVNGGQAAEQSGPGAEQREPAFAG